METRNGKQYSIQKYQGEHMNEVLEMELESGVLNGEAVLLKEGIIQMSWRMVRGKREGDVTIYEDGVASKKRKWDDLMETNNDGITREIVNSESGKEIMVIRMKGSGTMIYRGGYNKTTLNKEGYGIEYDEESSVEKFAGYYRNNNLVHYYQQFKKNKDGKLQMHEYDGDENVDNVHDSSNLRTIYIGGYRFDEMKEKIIRCGCGRVMVDRLCGRVVEYDENGVEIAGNGKELNGGWYINEEEERRKRREEEERRRKKEEEERRKRREEEERRRREERERNYWNEKVIACPGLNISFPRGIEVIEIPDNWKNGNSSDTSKMKIDLTPYKRVRRIEIGYECFQYIREFVLDGLKELESVKIGRDCFRVSKSQNRDDGVCQIVNCSKLRELIIEGYSFYDFKQFELSNVESLQSIQLGDHCFEYAENCILKSK